MKIVAIMGSPHKGNTYDLTQKIENILEKSGEVDFEYIHLKDSNLTPCKGCFVCFIKGEDKCPVKDGKQEIAQKLDEADGVIFVSPVYSMHVSYLYKRFIDRFAYVFHRPRYHGKYALIVAATGNLGLKETLKYMTDVARIWGFDVVGELGYYAVPKNTTMRNLKENKARTDETVREFYSAIKEKKRSKLTFTDYMIYGSSGSVYKFLEEMSPYDYQYWEGQGWLDNSSRYFHDNVRHNILLELPARIFGWLTGSRVKKALGKGIN